MLSRRKSGSPQRQVTLRMLLGRMLSRRKSGSPQRQVTQRQVTQRHRRRHWQVKPYPLMIVGLLEVDLAEVARADLNGADNSSNCKMPNQSVEWVVLFMSQGSLMVCATWCGSCLACQIRNLLLRAPLNLCCCQICLASSQIPPHLHVCFARLNRVTVYGARLISMRGRSNAVVVRDFNPLIMSFFRA